MLLSADNDSHANETAAKQESSLSLFGPIFLTFQQGLICWQKSLGPLTAKVTESTTHPADSKQGIWGMAFKQWLSHKPFCHQMLWKAYRLMIFFLGLQQFERPTSLPWVPSTPQAWVTAVLFAFPALQLWDGLCRCVSLKWVIPGLHIIYLYWLSRRSGLPPAQHCPNTGQHDALCPIGKILGFNFVQGIVRPGPSLTVPWTKRENFPLGREVNGNC